jgi:hypothetical protein
VKGHPRHFKRALPQEKARLHGAGAPIVLATNDFESSALEIAQRYKERWGIELFFKWIKQDLGIKQFLGRSDNAVRIQILAALISYLPVAPFKETNGQTRWDCLCLVRASLFQRPESEASTTEDDERHNGSLKISGGSRQGGTRPGSRFRHWRKRRVRGLTERHYARRWRFILVLTTPGGTIHYTARQGRRPGHALWVRSG